MHIHLALYDPSIPGKSGTYWTWFSERIPLDLLGQVYNYVLIKDKPADPNKLSSPDFWGGCVHLSDWVILYRFYNGGRDTYGRPGRYVILTAWVQREEAADSAFLELPDIAQFQNLAKSIPPCPVEKLELEWDIPGGILRTNPLSPGVESALAKGEYKYPECVKRNEALLDFITLDKECGDYHLIIHAIDGRQTCCMTKYEIPKPSFAEGNSIAPPVHAEYQDSSSRRDDGIKNPDENDAISFSNEKKNPLNNFINAVNLFLVCLICVIVIGGVLWKAFTPTFPQGLIKETSPQYKIVQSSKVNTSTDKQIEAIDTIINAFKAEIKKLEGIKKDLEKNKSVPDRQNPDSKLKPGSKKGK